MSEQKMKRKAIEKRMEMLDEKMAIFWERFYDLLEEFDMNFMALWVTDEGPEFWGNESFDHNLSIRGITELIGKLQGRLEEERKNNLYNAHGLCPSCGNPLTDHDYGEDD